MIKKIKLIIPILLICNSVTGQDLIIGAQAGVNVLQTKSYSSALMFGIRGSENDKFLIGAIAKRIQSGIGHSKSYLGIRVHAQSSTPIKITPFLSYDFIKGDYYIYSDMNDVTPKAKSRWQGQGTLGLGYPIDDNIDLFAGYVFMDYNPLKYVKENTSPYKDANISLKISVTLF